MEVQSGWASGIGRVLQRASSLFYRPSGSDSPKSTAGALDNVVNNMAGAGLGPGQGVVAAPGAGAYGGYDLRRGDRDDNNTFGGAQRDAARGERLPNAQETGYVRQLQRDLLELGYLLVGQDDGVYGRATEWAVREFQIYSKMPNVARATSVGVTARYLDSLVQQANAQRYAGPVSGVVNAQTRQLIQHWLAGRWRCPVIVEAHRVQGGTSTVVHENIWLKDEVTDTALRMYARDFSGYYTMPAGRNANDLHVLGDYTPVLQGGPRSVPPRHTWAEAELLPEHLVGRQLANLSAVERSTYKVVRAVSEVECVGFFDSLNAYDNAVMSLGPCHWTLALGTAADGEMPGYLAYLRHSAPNAYDSAIRFFGLDVVTGWVNAAGVGNGQALFDNGQRKYLGWIAAQREDRTFGALPRTAADLNYYRSWHWFYRFSMAGRTIQDFRRRQWHMARVRLRDILSTPWPANANVPDVPLPGGGNRPATIGDVFTSERVTGVLLRWHIRFPAQVIGNGQAGPRLTNALARAAVPAAAGSPDQWTDAIEATLLQEVMNEVNNVGNADLSDTISYVHDWPRWAGGANPRGYALDPTIGNLAVTRGSFQFDTADLPPAPP